MASPRGFAPGRRRERDIASGGLSACDHSNSALIDAIGADPLLSKLATKFSIILQAVFDLCYAGATQSQITLIQLQDDVSSREGESMNPPEP
jgi:hypothetical protein